MTRPADVQAAFCATLVDEWARAGVSDAVVAPGSRSTPLVLALAGDGRLALHVVLDERSAGFVALGLGLATGRPAPVVTTSGTAAVELHPAVVEAHQAGVPLLAVTADRPPELHHVGAPQTIEQDGLYGGATRGAFSPGVADLASVGAWRSLAARCVAVAAGAGGRPGPVQLNLAFREPLLGDPAGAAIPEGRSGGRPWHAAPVAGPAGAPPEAVVAALAGARGRRGLIVAGAGAGDPDAVLALGRTLGWPVLADPRSGARRPGAGVVVAADALLRVPEVAGWRPELVLRLGQPWASKVLGQWLARLGPEITQVLIDPSGTWADPDRRVSDVVCADPTLLARAVVARAVLAPAAAAAGRRFGGAAGGLASPWAQQWTHAEAAAQDAIDAALAVEAGLSEPGVARAVVAGAPEGATLVVSSSMPVRDVEWYGPARSGLRVLANRGANGIDGVLSTAIGVALGDPGAPTVALVGDLAFLYDAGALLWADRRRVDLTIVVVDNDGGGIFSFLPQADELSPARFERHWGTPHGLDVAVVAAAYGVPVRSLQRLDELAPRLREGFGVRVVVAPTGDRSTNVALHDRIHRGVAAAVEGWAAGARA